MGCLLFHKSLCIVLIEFIFLYSLMGIDSRSGRMDVYSMPALLDTGRCLHQIDSVVREIDRMLPYCSRKVVEVLEYSTQGGEVVGYYRDGKVVKVHVWLYGETGRMEEEIYFEGDSIWLINVKNFYYDRTIYEDSVVKVLCQIDCALYMCENRILKVVDYGCAIGDLLDKCTAEDIIRNSLLFLNKLNE